MKAFVVIGLLASLGLFGIGTWSNAMPLGQTDGCSTAVGTPIGEYANLSALGILAVVVIFMVTKILPDLFKKFTDQGQAFSNQGIEQSKHFAATCEKMFATLDNNTREVTALRTHCVEHLTRSGKA